MAMVLQQNRVTSSNSSTVPMDSFNQLQSSNNHEDTFQRKIFDKIQEGKRDRDPEKCHQILEDLMKMLKHLTADVNNYNLAFRETRPPFYVQEFERLTDHIEILTKARDTLTEFLRELEDQQPSQSVPNSSLSSVDVSSPRQIPQYSSTISPSMTRSSPTERMFYHNDSPSSSIQSGLKENFHQDHSANLSKTDHHLTSPSTSTQASNRSRSPSMTPSNFIRVHFPNKHTTALAPRSDETLEVALESRALRHSVLNLRAYTPVYKRSREPCSWDIPLDRLLETEIELEEKPKFAHSFENTSMGRFPRLTRIRCVFCQHRIREPHKRCVSCGNHYHNHCYAKASVCSHPMLQQIRHLGPDHFYVNHHPNTPNQTRDQSRSLPRILPQRPVINRNTGIGVDETSLVSPESLRTRSAKPNTDVGIDNRKPPTKYVSEWEIRSEDLLNHGRMVGRGTYGTVYKAEVRLHGKVALKELNFISPTQTQFQAFRNEVHALKKITHQNTLNFYGYIISPRFAIVTQWCEGSTLYKHIHILDRHWKTNQLIDIARQLCQGMSYLHDRGIIHRDLKSSNVFLDTSAEPDDVGGNGRVKIGDFGLAAVKAVPSEGINQQCQPTGSVLWMAPEVIQQKEPDCYSPESDIYAYGCVLFEMFSGKLPHAPISNKEQIMWQVGKGRLKLKVEQCRDDTPEAITDLIRQCTEYDRTLRPKFAPEIDDTLSKFEFIFPRLQRSQSEPCLIRNTQDDLLGLTMNFGVPKTPISIHRRFNAEVS